MENAISLPRTLVTRRRLNPSALTTLAVILFWGGQFTAPFFLKATRIDFRLAPHSILGIYAPLHSTTDIWIPGSRHPQKLGPLYWSPANSECGTGEEK